MCGIFGIVASNQQAGDIQADLEKMAAALHHRGPDDNGIFYTDGIGIGNTRLSIIDIESGHQPMASKGEDVVVVQNGEIFNFIELKEELLKKHPEMQFHTNSDTEVILKTYLVYGESFVSKLNGMFSIAIVDKRYNKIHLYRDRFGIKPLYIYNDRDRVLFASEMKAITAVGCTTTINQEAISNFLFLNFIPSPLTIYNEIASVKPGFSISICLDAHKKSEKQWWSLNPSSLEHACDSDWLDSIEETLVDSVRIRMRCDTPYGAFLSGGVDSSLISSIMNDIAPNSNTFSIGFDHPKYDETEDARLVANYIDSKHHISRFHISDLDHWPLTHFYCEQPHGDTSFIPTYLVSKHAKKHVKVVLGGDGADEVFGGYSRHTSFLTSLNSERTDVRPELWLNSSSVLDFAQISKLYHGYKRIHRENLEHQISRTFSSLDSSNSSLDKFLFTDLRYLLPGNNLVKPDRMGMANSIEIRTPFLDYRLVELAFSMPEHLKIDKSRNKVALREILMRRLPESFSNKKKKMFAIPIAEWLSGELLAKYRNKVTNPEFLDNLEIDSSFVNTLFNAHKEGKANNTRPIRSLASLAIWHECFVDKKTTTSPLAL